MRLICPSCDAQYEVGTNAIPLAGRDVQCSNCGHAWFQGHEPEDEDPAAPLYRTPAGRDDDDDDDDDGGDLDRALGNTPAVAEPPAPAQPLPRRTLDDSVLAVLREEAAHETAARRAEASSLEIQGDLGLPPPVSASVAAPIRVPDRPMTSASQTATEKRLAAIKGEPVAPPKPAARRDLLPDIEEINSTLSPNDRRPKDREEDMPDLKGPSGSRSGFRSGFVLMLLAAGIAAAVYIMAPKITQQIPGAEGAMTAYVAGVDAARVWLDGLIRQATGALNGFTGNDG